MDKWVCDPCGYVYDPAEGDPDNGIAPGTAFEDLPDDWYAQYAVQIRTNSQKNSKLLCTYLRPVALATGLIYF